MSKITILIGGAPTLGKSTVAAGVAKKLGLPWISVDQLRDFLRVAVREEDHPDLFNPFNDAEKFLNRYSPEEIVAIEEKQGIAIWPFVKETFIDHNYSWQEGGILEGVNVLPELVKDVVGDEVKGVFLVDDNEDRMRKVVFERGLWDDANLYSDLVKEKEVEWAMLFNKKISEDAKRLGLPIVKVCKDGKDMQRVLRVLGL